MIRTATTACLVATAVLGTAHAQALATPAKGEGLIMLDYEVVPVPGNASLDLMGFHFLNKMNDWFYLGIGGYAPLFKGEYGGFMALDVTAHAQRRLFGNVFANAGISLGGGGGGKSLEQSKILSGTGGFYKVYAGLGYEFPDFSLGANIAKIKFQQSAIEHSQLNVFAQFPFSYAIGSYASSGQRYVPADGNSGNSNSSGAGLNTLTLGLERFKQIRPKGSNKKTITVIDLQFSHYITENAYWYIDAGVGAAGMPLYNQVLGGLGYKWPLSPKLNVYSQIAVGSGGYAPETIDTGPGLLVYPKLSAEYRLDRNFGLSLSAGYLFAPKATSKNYTVGAALNYHLQSADGGGAGGEGAVYRGYRINLFPQTEFNLVDRDVARGNIRMVTAQLDSTVSDHVYIPMQVSVAYNAYIGYPGYGELFGGVGVQTKYEKGELFQFFAHAMAGANSRGLIFKTGAGLTVGLSDQLALYGVAGQTFARRAGEFKNEYVGLGLSYRFSSPSR